MVEVLHVDYGKKLFVPVEHVRPLASEFFRMPVVTYVCSLHGVVDRGIGWTASQIDYLKSLLLNRTVIARFEYQSLSEGVHYVTLYGDENTNINSLFGSRELCLMDPKTHEDVNVCSASGTSQKPQISLQCETQGSDRSGDLKGNMPVFYTESLKPDSSHVAMVQHVDSPSKFWIQTQRYALEFDQLMKGLEELYCDSTSVNGLIKKPVPGLLCVARSQDVFYRAVVCEVIDGKADVFFLDYGNGEMVDCISLRELPFRYQKLPALAVKCSLYGVQPRSNHWDQMAVLFFSNIVRDKLLDVHVLAKSQDTHVVQLFDPFSHGESDLSELLCSAGFADHGTKKKDVGKPVVKPEVNQSFDKFKSNAPFRSSRSPAVTAAFKEYLFPIGSSLDVTVSYIESANDFWCQKACNVECLKLLMRDLQNYYASSEFQPPLEAACVARHPENGLWYRALVIQKHQTAHVSVLFVDYGEVKKVAVLDLRHINPMFLKLEGQAFRCSLYNYHPDSQSTSEWSQDATVLFQEFVDHAASMNVLLKCTVYAVMCDTRKVVYNVVDLETPFQSVCRQLIQRGLVDRASSKKSHLPPLRMDTYYYSTHNIKTGSEEDVSVTNVETVNRFFCHLCRNSVQLDKLAKNVNSLCRQLEKTDCPKVFGKVCFAKYTDGLWYRGLIQSAQPSIVVHFVDYGDTQDVDKSDLLPVPIEAGQVMSVPVQAIECGLSDMPEQVQSEANKWFGSFVTGRCLRALVVAKEPCGKLIVELYDGKTQLNAMIKDKFRVDVKRNKQVRVKGFHVADSSGENCENQSHQFKIRKESQIPLDPWRSLKSPASGPIGRSKKSYNGVMEKDMIPKRTSCHAVHKESNSESEDVTRAFAKPSVLKLEDLQVKDIRSGLDAEVFISHCNSPLSFFVQFLSDESDICSLVEKLNDIQLKSVPLNPSDIQEGHLVSAVFPDDDCWYRAVVRTAPVCGMVSVEFIDFGNTADVSVSQVCVLDRIFSQPRYSVHCSLAGVLNPDKEVTSNFKKEIEKNNRMMCTFIQQSGSVWEVKLDNGSELLVSTDTAITITDSPKSPVTKQDLFNNLFTKNTEISVGQSITVYTSFISGPQLFWCQYAETDKLQELCDVIQKAGNRTETRVLDEESVAVGSGCIALFDEDQLWYRAKVISRELDTLSVLFVDYGNESKVKLSEVRSLPPEVADVPPQAFACQLDGFDVAEGSWGDNAADQFFELIDDKLLKVTVLKLGSLDDQTTCHFVQLECEKHVINDAMEDYWIPKCPGLAKSPDVASFANEPEFLCSENEIPKEALQVATEYQLSDKDSTLQMQCHAFKPEDMTEDEEKSRSVEILDKSDALVEVVSSEVDPELNTAKLVEEGLSQETETTASNTNSDDFGEQPISQNSNMNPEFCTSPPDVLEENSLHATDLSDKPFTGSQCIPQDPESGQLNTAEIECVILHDTENLKDLASQKWQPNEEFYENVCDHSLDSLATVHEENHEIIKSDLGHLRKAAEKIKVGLECVIWSDAHTNWCRAKTVKISDDSTLVLLLDYDSLMIVDPLNVFEVVPEESFQVLDVVGTDMPKEVPLLVPERTSAELTCLVPEDEHVGCVACLGVSDQGEEMVDETIPGNFLLQTEEQPQNEGQDAASDDLVELSDLEPMLVPERTSAELIFPVPEDEHVPGFASLDVSDLGDLKMVYQETAHQEMADEPITGMYLLEIKELPQNKGQDSDASDDLVENSDQQVLRLDPGIEFKQTLRSCFAVKAQTKGAEETCPLAEEQRVTLDCGTETCEEEEELMNFVFAIPPEKAQDLQPEMKPNVDVMPLDKGPDGEPGKPDVDTLIEEVNSFTKDLIDVTSVDEQESDPTSNERKDNRMETELSAVAGSSELDTTPFICDCPDPEESPWSRVTHLTIKIEDTADDVVFVKAWQVSPTEPQPGSEE